MWSYEHSADASATPETVWPYFEDVAGWPTWNEGIEHIVLEGPFAPGTTFLMTPPGGADDQLHRLPTGTRITYRMEITGEQADTIGPEIGPAISGDFPQVIAALIALAEREQDQSTTR
jgi:hypothetical protein